MVTSTAMTMAMAVASSPEKSIEAMAIRPWAKTALVATQRFDQYLGTIPPNRIQKGADFVGAKIHDLLNLLLPFNNWLDKAIGGNWYQKLALTLVKLPFLVARSVVQMLYYIIKEALSAPFHPLVAINKLAKFLIVLADALTRVETYALIGVNILGFSAGQACLGNPYSIITLIVGAALVASSLGIGAIIEAIHAEKGHKTAAALNYVKNQIKPLVTAFAASFIVSVTLGVITKFAVSKVFPSTVTTSTAAAKPDSLGGGCLKASNSLALLQPVKV